MKSVRTFGLSNGHSRYDFEIMQHGQLFYLYLNKRKIARADSKEKLDCYIDGFVKGSEMGYGDGYESHKEFSEKKKVEQTT